MPLRTSNKAWLKIEGYKELDTLSGYPTREDRQALRRATDEAIEVRGGTPKPNVKPRQNAGDELKRWIRAVGYERATAAWLTRNSLMRGRPGGKPTFIECLAEAFLVQRGTSYEAQVEMGIARPDYVVFNTRPDGGAVAWNINGDYWHAPKIWHGQGKASALINLRVRDVPILDVIDVWESDILQSDQVFGDALKGERWRD